MSSSTGTPSQARRARPGPPNPLAAVASTSEEDAAATTGAPLPVALALAPSAAVFADALTEAARPCHLYYVYEDDTALPDLVLAHATVHVDLALSAPGADGGKGEGAPQPQAGDGQGPWLAIRDCRALQPHALRVYGAELAGLGPSSPPPSRDGEGGDAGRGAPGVLRLYGFSKPRVEVESPESVLEELERRNLLIRAALAATGPS